LTNKFTLDKYREKSTISEDISWGNSIAFMSMLGFLESKLKFQAMIGGGI